MKIIITDLGPVEVTNVSMQLAKGWNSYVIAIEMKFENNINVYRVHTNDSELWHELSECDSLHEKSMYLHNKCSNLIELAVKGFVKTL
jgi:hypothetical protein